MELQAMAFSKLLSFVIFLLCLLQIAALAQPSAAPSPAPANDGSMLDLGIAYALMFVALFVTYIIHPVDTFPFNLF
ncbi:hypothetical protein KP509_28G043700 [Ceratopteris richardii]|uniref:Uncharacterized protein n=1 Tax=Ceratopteris richardii TaxID=49495 RepID=A0A8T2RBJ0_CERRI|nr:hypothetical protein KP509_28G043700 [Ceratopteris richardii]